MARFAAQGFDRVKPPLIEFEESLLDGSGVAMAKHTFRVMDPVTQKMMGVRADMTLQVARIASTRLANAPRPLRLSYAGQVLRVKGSQLRPERQFGQAGIELIGATGAAADAEVVILAAKALVDLGVGEVCVDLTVPPMVPEICAGMDDIEGLHDALDHKDVAAIAALAGAAAPTLVALVEAVGPAAPALAKLAAIRLPEAAAALRDHLAEVVGLVRAAAPELTLTIDPVEGRGFEYHSGVAFAIFARQSAAELGRGGRYKANGEWATGATLYMDTVLDVLPGPVEARRVFLPFGTSFAVGQALREEGWVTLAGLEQTTDDEVEARRLSCGHRLMAGRVLAVK